MPTLSEFKSNIFLLFLKGSSTGRFGFGFKSAGFMTEREISFLTDNGTQSAIPSPHYPPLSGGFRELHPLLLLNFPWLLSGICQLTLTIYWSILLIWNTGWWTATTYLGTGRVSFADGTSRHPEFHINTILRDSLIKRKKPKVLMFSVNA